MTTGGQDWPWRVACRFQKRAGRVALDQVRTVDRERLVGYLGRLEEGTLEAVLKTLVMFFTP